MTDIQVTDLTNSTTDTEGTGVFDLLMQSVERRIEQQHKAGRITGSNFAEVYLGSLQTALTESIKFLMSEQQAGHAGDEAKQKVDLVIGQTAEVYAKVSLIGQQQESELANTATPTGGILKQKYDLLAAQTLGFASDSKIKVLKQMFEGYAVTLSIGGLATPPDAVDEPQIDALTQEILTDIGTSVNIP